MFSGFGFRLINLDGLSTHHLINEIGYKYALRRTKKRGFPRIISIDLHSGYYGPDGKWSKPISKVSHHMYNPTTDQGDAIESAVESYKLARKHIHLKKRQKLDKKLSQFTCARGLHFLVDGLTPSHHIGENLDTDTPNNWHDPHWDHTKGPAYNILWNKHGQFEHKCARYMFFNTKKIIKNYKKLRRHQSVKPLKTANSLKKFLKQKAKHIHQTGTYEKFLNGENIKEEMIKTIFPEIIHAVEIYVRSLYHSEENNKKNARKRTVHIPRTSDIKRFVVQNLVSKKPRNKSSWWKKFSKSSSRENI